MRKQLAWQVFAGEELIEAKMLPPYSADALVEWGSVTKPLVALTVTRLVAEGKLSYTTAVHDLMPGLGVHPSILVEDLLRHTSGLPRVHPGMKSGVFTDPYSGLDRRTLLEVLAQLPTAQVPPRTTLYSNLGYAALGLLIEEVSGVTWFESARYLVLAPGGINTATLTPDRAVQRALLDGWARRQREPWQISGSPYSAAGGVWSTLDDLRRFTRWAGTNAGADPTLTGWQQEGSWLWHNGQTRDSGACVVTNPETRVTVVAHTSGHLPHAADRLARQLMAAHDPAANA